MSYDCLTTCLYHLTTFLFTKINGRQNKPNVIQGSAALKAHCNALAINPIPTRLCHVIYCHWKLSLPSWTICRFVWSGLVHFILINENFKLVLIFTYAITLESHWLGRREKSIHYAPLLDFGFLGGEFKDRLSETGHKRAKLTFWRLKLSLSIQNNRVPLHLTCLTKKRVGSKTSVTWIECVIKSNTCVNSKYVCT